jgi:hypothetical protein
MTTRTRRRVLVSLVVLALTLPAESILLKAVAAPNVKDAAKQYVTALSSLQLQAAAGRIQTYPLAYRRQIMAALTPDVRAKVWQNHVANYEAQHPGLDANTASRLDAVAALITPELLSDPTASERAQVLALIGDIQQSIGADDARSLFRQLGPDDGFKTVSEPIVEKLANYVRKSVELLADGSVCDCNDDTDCSTAATVCGDDNGCSPTGGMWPFCGWLWMEDCHKQCRAQIM